MYVNVEHWIRTWREAASTANAHLACKVMEPHLNMLDFILATPEAISLVTDIFHTGDVQALKDAERTKAIYAVVDKSERVASIKVAAAAAKIPWEDFVKALPGLLRILLTLNARR